MFECDTEEKFTNELIRRIPKRPGPGRMPEQVRSTDQGPATAPMDVWLSVRSSLRSGTHLMRAARSVMHKRSKLMSIDRTLYFFGKGLCDRIW